MGNSRESALRRRILDAAEAAFADKGYAGASIREIALEAEVNLATVYYYFDSKDGLLEAVLKRRMDPLEREHLELLREHEGAAGGPPPSLERLLENMLSPPLRLAASGSRESQAARRLFGRILTEPDPKTQRLLKRQQHAIREAYLAALRRSVPHLTEADLQWRFEFFWGALAFVLCNPAKLEVMTGGVCDPADIPALRAQMLHCFAAGFRAPAAPKAPSPRRARPAPA